ncbi:MAG TPA: hypothetical protein C5S37_04120 [Methanophagales archaeon]|nr:hypothetical protein [Methanophagales archaeon]
MKTKIEVFREEIRKLVEKFERDKYFYLSKQYLEAQARHDFIDRFFEALGWDIGNRAGLSPFEREVLLEKGETKGRPDYNFRVGGASKFYVEAKAPSEPLDKTAHILQAKSYAWNTKDVFIVVLTDFEEFKVFDATLKPDPRNPNLGLIYDFKYTDYLEKLDKLWMLSRDEVASGSLDRLLLKDAQSKRLRIPVDKSFLSDMTGWREELAKDLYKRNPDINVRMLNEVVQRILDRFVFIRIAEDRKVVEPKSLLELVELWKREGKRRPLQYHLNILFRQINADLNGEIFKPHACESYEFDSSLLAKIIEWLYFPKCPYRFDVIGVELLGSIYERYLGNTIRLTAKRVKVEEKPEVRKAGGVYYTPKYIVDYIVDNTVGKLIEGKTQEEIAEIKILDPACGSGSFLLGAYQKLIDYHIKYYTEHPAEAGRSTLFPDLIIDPDGSHRLSITKKAEILQNNIFGVDIDPQAVEVSMMSLYIKALEGERTLPQNKELLPSLANNIMCGNSLIGYDFFEQQTLIEDEERERVNPFDWNSKKAGFGDIMEKGGFDVVMGNPPYITYSLGRGRVKHASEEVKYIAKNYPRSSEYKINSFAVFYEKALQLSRPPSGLCAFIVPGTILINKALSKIRLYLISQVMTLRVVSLNYKVFADAEMGDCAILLVQNRHSKKYKIDLHQYNSERWIEDSSFDKVTSDVVLGFPEFRLYLKSFVYDILRIGKSDKFKSFGEGEIAKFYNGIKTGNNKKFLADKKFSPKHVPVIRGRDFDRYGTAKPKLFVYFDPEKLWSNCNAARLGAKDKIIIRQTGDRIVATIDPNSVFCMDTVHMIYETSLNRKFLLGLLNSRFLDYYHCCLVPELGKAFAEIKIANLKKLPICTIDFNNPKEKEAHDKLVALVDRMLELNSKKNALPPSSERERIEREIAVTDERIDEIVYGLYGLTEEEIRVVESA